MEAGAGEFESYARTTLANIDRKTDLLPEMAETVTATDKKMDRALQIMEASFRLAARERRITEQLQDKDEEIARLAETLQRLQEQVGERTAEPGEAKLAELLQSGDLTAALALKSKQVERRRAESAKLPQDLFELGTIYELRFDWQKALDAYRAAWRLQKNPQYGLRYAYLAQKQNSFVEALDIYGMTLIDYRQLAKSQDAYLPYVAAALNNSANLYVRLQRYQEAECAFEEALSIRRALANSSPLQFLSDVAITLNNLSCLYDVTGKNAESEAAHKEALVIRRVLVSMNPAAHSSDLAVTLNNMALLFTRLKRYEEAEGAYTESLFIRREFPDPEAEADLHQVGSTLNNLASLYSDMHRYQDAETGFTEALSIYRKLVDANPDIYRPHLARTLNNLAILFQRVRRFQEAETFCEESLMIRRKLAELNPEIYSPEVARTLFVSAAINNDVQRLREASAACDEAESILEPFCRTKPAANNDQMAKILLLKSSLAKHESAISLLQRGLGMAYDPSLQAEIQARIDQRLAGVVK